MITHRRQFPDLIDALSLTTAAEFGVGDGFFSEQLLRSRSLRKLYLIDPWPNPADAELRDRVFALARTHADRVEVIEDYTPAAAERFRDGAIDFIYIDAMHEYEPVKADLAAWFPKAARVLAGHDYIFWNTCVGCPIGVIPAVEEFAHEHQLLLHVTGAGTPHAAARLKTAYAALFLDAGRSAENFPSWYFIK